MQAKNSHECAILKINNFLDILDSNASQLYTPKKNH